MMRNMLADAAAKLAEEMERHASTEVSYSDGTNLAKVPAVLGQSEFPIATDGDVVTSIQTHDFIIRIERLREAGITEPPAAGHQITVGEVDDGETYEVMAPPGMQAWRYSDEHRRSYRIHTKHIQSNL